MSDELENNPVPELDDESNNQEPELSEEDLQEDEGAEEEFEAEEGDESSEDEGGQSEEGEAEPELVEIEQGGKKYQIPAELKDGFMLQADYTRKSQEVAEKARQIEAQTADFEKQRELQTATFEQSVALKQVDLQLEAFNQINWQQLMEEDPQQFQRLDWQRRQFAEQRNALANQIAHAQQEAFQKQREEYAKRKEQALTQVAKAIPGWSRETAEKLKSYGLGRGYPESRLRSLIDPLDIETLDKSRRWDELQATRNAPKPKQAVKDPPKPLKTKTAPAKKPMAKMSQDEWLRERERQLERKKKARR